MFTDFKIPTDKRKKACESDIPWLDDGVVDSFDPSRPPPIVVIKLPEERASAGKKSMIRWPLAGLSRLQWWK